MTWPSRRVSRRITGDARRVTAVSLGGDERTDEDRGQCWSGCRGASPLARLTLETIRVCLRYRVTGLAAEAAFFMLLSLPPLVLGLFGGLGYVGGWIGRRHDQQRRLGDPGVRLALPHRGEHQRAAPADRSTTCSAAGASTSSRWASCSRCGRARGPSTSSSTPSSIMYGQKDARGIVHMRAFSLLLYTLGILAGIVVLPLVLLGPGLLASLAAGRGGDRHQGALLADAHRLQRGALASMYHVSTPRRSPWRRDVPGAVLAWRSGSGASFVVRISLEAVARRLLDLRPAQQRRSSCSSGCMRWPSPSSSAPASTRPRTPSGRSPCTRAPTSASSTGRWRGPAGLLTAPRATRGRRTPTRRRRTTAWTAGRRRLGRRAARPRPAVRERDRGPITAAIQRGAGDGATAAQEASDQASRPS